MAPIALRISNRKLIVLFISLGIVLASFLIFSEKAGAAPSSTYPSCCSANTYVSVSNTGNGINLSAPFSYLKVKYGSDTVYHDISIYDGCYHGSGSIDHGGPASCTGGQTKFWVCPSTPSGTFDSNYKNQGRCYEADAAAWPSGAGTQLLRFYNSGTSNPQSGAMQMSTVGGYRYLYVIAQMQVAGLNGFKVTATARNGGLGLASYANIGFMSTLGVDRPVSLVNLPLSAGGSTTFDLRFRIPCSYSGGTFPLRWYDADRGGAGVPIDYDIEWMLINQSSGQQFSAGQFAFIGARTGSPESLDTFLGANAETRQINVGNASFLRMQAGDLFTWRWYNVNNNNGVQVFLPFDEPDSDVNCDQPPRYNIDLARCDVIAGWLYDPDHSNGNIYNQNGTFNNSTGSMLMHLYKNGVYQGQYVSDDYSGDKAYNPPDPRADVNGTFKIDGRHRFSVELAGMNAGTNRFTLYMLGINNNGTVNNVNPPIYDGNIGPCTTPPAVACGNITTNPALPEPGEPFTVRVNFTTSGGSGPDTDYTVSLEVPGYFEKDIIGTGTVARNGGSVNVSTSPDTITINNPGTYDGTFTVEVVDGNPNPLSCPFGSGQPRPPIVVASRPIIQAFAGDVRACGIPSGRIQTFNRGSDYSYAGSSSQLAAYSNGTVMQFISAALTTSPAKPKGLTFANKGPSNSSGNPGTTYGGGFADITCIENYWNPPTPPAAGNVSVGPVTGIADKQTIYVDGNLTIGGNITYADSGWSTTTTPYRRYVVKGDIFIDPAVTQLDGDYIATGTIYTCAAGAVPTALFVQNSCYQNRLTVYGSFIAPTIRFLRMAGTLRNANAADTRSTSQAAEIFIQSPENWFGQPNDDGISDSITGLPPLL